MSTSCTARPPSKAQDSRLWILGTIVLIAAWIVLYRQLETFSRWLTSQLPLQPGSHFADAVAFFVYDTPKVLMLLTLVVFAMGIVRVAYPVDSGSSIYSG